jgi:ZIP family zinc transporter
LGIVPDKGVLMALLVALGTVFATFLGGLLALRARKRMHLVLGLSAGLLLGLVSFDLIPEVFILSKLEVGHVPAVMVMFVFGFLSLHILERYSGAHEPHDSKYSDSHEHSQNTTGVIAASAMVIHVFLDGLAIGIAFQVSSALGWIVAIAVVAHAFTDGLNTVSMLISAGRWQKQAIMLLIADAVARISGAYLGARIVVNNDFLGLYLALFAGFLIYLATSHILPEAHSNKPSRMTLLATVAGVLVMFVIVNLVHG